MTSAVTGVNRVLVTLIGLAVLVVGVASILLSTGAASTLLSATGLAGTLSAPGTDDPVRDLGAPPQFGSDGVLVLVLVAALVLALLCLWWLIAQLPPRRTTRSFRLATTGTPGSTTVDPSALEDALEAELGALTGVTAVRAEVHGAATEPRLTVRVTADEQADVGALTEAVHATAAADIGTALQVPIDRLAVLLDLSAPGRGSSSVVSLGHGARPVTDSGAAPALDPEPVLVLVPTSPVTPVRIARRSPSGER